MEISINPIAFVKNSRLNPIDDNWENIISEIELAPHIPTESFDSIENFSHLQVIYYFDKVGKEEIIYSGHPRGNVKLPRVGIFSQRKKDRPNKIGLCTVQLLEHKDRKITVKFLDAINGSPVLDIKPVFKEFEPKGELIQPGWVEDLMKNYW